MESSYTALGALRSSSGSNRKGGASFLGISEVDRFGNCSKNPKARSRLRISLRKISRSVRRL